MSREALLLSLLLAACDQAPATISDGGVVPPFAEPAPPIAPEPASMAPCAPGWREIALGDGAIVCEPWAEDRAPDCGETELAIPGRGCEPIDTCPSDGWPTDLPADAIYVRAGAIYGNGTRTRPYGTLAEGLAAASGGDRTVALAVGEYTGGVVFQNHELRGACASGVIVRSPGDVSAIQAYAPAARIRGLRIVAEVATALRLREGASLVASDLIVEGTVAGLRLEPGTRFEGDRVRIVGRREQTQTSIARHAINLRPRSTVVLRASTILGGEPGAIGGPFETGDPVPNETTVTIEDSAIFDTLFAVDGSVHRLHLRRSAIERTTVAVAVGAGATFELTDVRARDIDLRPTLFSTTALGLVNGTLTLTRVFVTRSSELTLDAFGEGARIDGQDVVVTDVTRTGAVVAGLGGGVVSLDRLRVDRADGAVFAVRGGGAVSARDVVVEGVAGGDVVSAVGGTAELERVRARDVGRAFALAAGGATLTAADVDVEGGIGISVHCSEQLGLGCDPGVESFLSLSRARMRGMRGYAVDVGRARAEILDLDVDGVEAAFDTNTGAGLVVYGTVEAERVRLRSTTSWGVLVGYEGSHLTARDLVVDGVAPTLCTDESCGGATMDGDGVMCALGGNVSIEDFLLTGAQRAGFAVAAGCAELALRRGDIQGNTIGILTDRSESSRRIDDARVHDNETDSTTTDLVVMPPQLWE